MSILIRLLDVIFSLLGLICGFPVFLLIYILGLFDSGSPIFKQERVGRKQRAFILIKFRTMSVNTPSVASHLASTASITKLGVFCVKPN